MNKLGTFCAIALALGCIACHRSDNAQADKEYIEQTPNVVTPKKDKVDDFVVESNRIIPQNARPMLVDFSASWCPPCRQLHPIFEKLKEEYMGKVDFVTIDVDNFKELATAYGVQNIPTIVFLNPDGKELNRTVGLIDEAQLNAEITTSFNL